MTFRVWHLLLFVLLAGLVAGGVAWRRSVRRAERERRSAKEAATREARLDSHEGYAAARVRADLSVRFNAQRQAYIGGTITNAGDRPLSEVYARLQLLDEAGNPRGRGRLYPLGPLPPGETREVTWLLYTVSKDALEPDPDRGGVMTYDLPPARVTVARVAFADE